MNIKQKSTYFGKACGKVLIAGGYGVLEKNNIGLSLALQNYFYCKIEYIETKQNTEVSVISPQIHKRYKYIVDQKSLKLVQSSNQQNLFVQNALYFSLKHFKLFRNFGRFNITILFDKGFISQKSIEKNDQKFASYAQNYTKTGLGSSACVIVSIVTSICGLMGQGQNKNLINVISQVANLAAQKKIGSNFDISTAVYGTHLYKNIYPHLAFEYIDGKELSELLLIDPEIKHLQKVNQILLSQAYSFMIDISKGANTRVMVTNFLKNLRNQSQQIQDRFFHESKLIANDLWQTLQEMNNQEFVINLKEVNRRQRKLQQQFSKITNTSVQPQQISHFLDDLLDNPNVLYAVCPGSGGFDALFMLCLKKQQKNYYEKLIDSLREKHQKQLGQEVQFNLKQIFIKFTNQIQVNQQEIQQIKTFMTKNQ